MHQPLKHYYEFGPFRLNATERLLLRDGAAISLTPKAFDLLLVLIAQPGHLLTKDELIQALWPDAIVEETNLAWNISHLRKALGEGEQGKRYIETVPRRGYRFVAEVRDSAENEAEQRQRDMVKADVLLPPRFAFSPRRVLVTSAALLVLALPLYYFWSKRTVAPIHSLAVLPFKSLQADGRDEYLGLGLADTLITKLGGLRQLIVRPTSAVRKYSHSEQDPLAAGREQQVEAVLDASLQRNGERIRVNVRLLKVGDGATLWTYQCDEQYCADLFTMQDVISEKVAAALTSELSGEERTRLRKHYTENKAAYDLYTKGRFFTEKRTHESLQTAEGFYQQTLALDPTYALAYIGLADIYFQGLGSSLPERERMAKSKAAAERALALDETLSEAHTTRARILWKQDLNWAEAKQEFARAIELDPNNAFAHRIYGNYLSSLGRHEEAIAELKLSQRLDPLSLAINLALGTMQYYAGENDQALTQFRETQKLDPNFVETYHLLGMVYAQKGMYVEAIGELEKALPFSEMYAPRTKYLLAQTYAMWGKKEEANKRLAEVKELAQQERVLPIEMACFYTALGDKDTAFEWLHRACRERDRYTIYLQVAPKLKPLRSDPRFAEMLRCIGLPQ